MIEATIAGDCLFSKCLFNLKKCNNSKQEFIIWTSSKKLSRKDFEGTKPKRLDSIYKAHAKALDGMQVLYDDETNHSSIIDKQESWNLQIRKTLDSLNTYSAR